MEELRSTDVLDREILEDARKKAYRIIKAADDTLAAQDKTWGKKIQRSIDSIKKTYEERTKKNAEEIIARFPLDKRRLRSETAENFLLNAMDEFLRELKREKLLSILERELSERLKGSFTGDESVAAGMKQKIEVFYSGLSLSETRGILEKVLALFGEKSNTLDENVELIVDNHAGEFPSLVINTQSQKIIASVENAARTLMQDKRAELAAALLGEGVLND